MRLQQAFPGSDYKNSDGVPCNQLNLFALLLDSSDCKQVKTIICRVDRHKQHK